MRRAILCGVLKEIIKQPRTAAELYPGRLSITIEEFCAPLGWNRARYYRHRGKIKVLSGFGKPMIPVAELDRVSGIQQGEDNADV